MSENNFPGRHAVRPLAARLTSAVVLLGVLPPPAVAAEPSQVGKEGSLQVARGQAATGSGVFFAQRLSRREPLRGEKDFRPRRADGPPCVAWGTARLEAALTQAGYRLTDGAGTNVMISVGTPEELLTAKARKPDGYRLVAEKDTVQVVGFDAAGAMYGCLELERRVRQTGCLPSALDLSDSPALSLRGVCVFLMKLGTYDYPVTPKEFPFFYDTQLWLQYLDYLAENRFNYVAFWNGHPFDYFVKLDKYPEAQAGMEPGLLERNHDLLMWLGAEAERRNIWLMFQFYNIHTSVYFQKAHGLPTWNPQPTPLLADYTGHCIERFVSEFPSVGLYICPGEALRLQYTDDWINNVILAAVKRTGKTPPIMLRAWGIDLPHAQKVIGNYPRLYTERKYNVEMIAGTEADPENAAWAKLSGNHVVNIHCMGNLEPFRWSPPAYIQKCVQSSLRAGATGLHLYPRKVWRWPYGCDRTPQAQLQWQRDWMWFESWGRYAWNPEADPEVEQQYWTQRLSERFGTEAAPRVLSALEANADVLPAIQRLIWLGNDNHTVVGAGITLEQIQKAQGIPFLPLPDTVRIPAWIEALKKGEKVEGESPVAFLSRKVEAAETAAREAEMAARAATRNQDEVARLETDAQAVVWVARFYRDKLKAAIAKSLADAQMDATKNRQEFAENLRASVDHFRQLTQLTLQTYDSISDVPAWNPTPKLPCPYHWSHVLPVFEKELAGHLTLPAALKPGGD